MWICDSRPLTWTSQFLNRASKPASVQNCRNMWWEICPSLSHLRLLNSNKVQIFMLSIRVQRQQAVGHRYILLAAMMGECGERANWNIKWDYNKYKRQNTVTLVYIGHQYFSILVSAGFWTQKKPENSKETQENLKIRELENLCLISRKPHKYVWYGNMKNLEICLPTSNN